MSHKPNPRTILANERTFLSWLRTGVSLMAFGFVVSKFDLFVHLHPVHVTKTTSIFNETDLGLAWVAAGIVVIVIASLHYHIVRHSIYHKRALPKSPLPTVLAVVLGVLGLAVFFYLLGVT